MHRVTMCVQKLCSLIMGKSRAIWNQIFVATFASENTHTYLHFFTSLQRSRYAWLCILRSQDGARGAVATCQPARPPTLHSDWLLLTKSSNWISLQLDFGLSLTPVKEWRCVFSSGVHSCSCMSQIEKCLPKLPTNTVDSVHWDYIATSLCFLVVAGLLRVSSFYCSSWTAACIHWD